MTLAEYCSGLLGEYNNNLKSITDDSTKMIFERIKKPTSEIMPAMMRDIKKGKFYMLHYNYNGNKLWCPIFIIDDRYSTELQKRILYAINIDYLPYKYRIVYFDKLFAMFKDTLDRNSKNNANGGNVNSEISFKVNFESIYRSLKNNGDFSYAITAFDFSKIVGMDKGTPIIHSVSTNQNIFARFLYIDTRYVNRKIMMDAVKESDVDKEKEKLGKLIESMNEILDNFSMDSIEYYKKLKSLESNYKLYENI